MPGLQGPLMLRTVEVLCDVLVRNDFTRPDQLRDAPMIVEWVGAAMLTGAESIFLCMTDTLADVESCAEVSTLALPATPDMNDTEVSESRTPGTMQTNLARSS